MASPHGLFHEGNRHPRQGVYVRFHFEQVFGLLFVEMPRGEPETCMIGVAMSKIHYR